MPSLPEICGQQDVGRRRHRQGPAKSSISCCTPWPLCRADRLGEWQIGFWLISRHRKRQVCLWGYVGTVKAKPLLGGALEPLNTKPSSGRSVGIVNAKSSSGRGAGIVKAKSASGRWVGIVNARCASGRCVGIINAKSLRVDASAL